MATLSFDEVFNQIKINFHLIGIPLYETKFTVRFFVFFSLILVTVIQEILFFFSKFSHENFLELTQLAPCISVGTLSIIKIVLIGNKRHNIVELTDSLKTLYENATKDTKKYNVIRQDCIFLTYLVKYFFLLNAILICVYNFSTILIFVVYYCAKQEVILRLPYDVLVPFSLEPWYSWLIVYLHSITSGFICVLYFTTVDALYFILTTHTCSQFAILSNEIIKLDEESAHHLNDIIKSHQYILKLSNDLEEIFTGPNLFNVLIGSLEICALGFNLVMGKWAQLPGVVLFLLSVLLQILMISVFGENLIQESKKIGDAAFLCKWYTMDKHSKKNILLLILRNVCTLYTVGPRGPPYDTSDIAIIKIRSHRSCRLTAFKYSTISYESFTKIISTSWSYFTILRTIYSPENIEKQI